MGEKKEDEEPRIDWSKLATAVLSAVLTAVVTYLGSRASK